MADPDADWLLEDTPEQPEEAPPQVAAPAAAVAEGVPAEDEFPPPPEELSEAQKKKKFICRHWIRPTNLQYKYIYNYRKNYYDDVIDYLDRRNKGLTYDTPRAQTWAERALRTYNRDIDRTVYSRYSSTYSTKYTSNPRIYAIENSYLWPVSTAHYYTKYY